MTTNLVVTGELCRAHYMAGNANWKDVFRLMGRI
jgi:hypothetical protein